MTTKDYIYRFDDIMCPTCRILVHFEIAIDTTTSIHKPIIVCHECNACFYSIENNKVVNTEYLKDWMEIYPNAIVYPSYELICSLGWKHIVDRAKRIEVKKE